MKVVVITGPRGCGKLARARELARERGTFWREYFTRGNRADGFTWHDMTFRGGGYQMSATVNGPHEASAFVFADAHEFTAEQFMKAAAFAAEANVDVLLTTIGARGKWDACPHWLDRLILSDAVELVELQPETESQRSFVRICGVIERSA